MLRSTFFRGEATNPDRMTSYAGENCAPPSDTGDEQDAESAANFRTPLHFAMPNDDVDDDENPADRPPIPADAEKTSPAIDDDNVRLESNLPVESRVEDGEVRAELLRAIGRELGDQNEDGTRQLYSTPASAVPTLVLLARWVFENDGLDPRSNTVDGYFVISAGDYENAARITTNEEYQDQFRLAASGDGVLYIGIAHTHTYRRQGIERIPRTR